MENVPERIKKFSYDIIYYVLVAVELILFIRFLLKFVGANPENASVNFFFNASFVLTEPFYQVFKTYSSGNIVFEPSTLVAMVIYAIIALLLVKLVQLIDRGFHGEFQSS